MPLVRAPGLTPLLTATQYLTAAQILALHSTPIDLVPAPGAGFIQLVFAVALSYQLGSVRFQPGAGDLLHVVYGGGNDDDVITPVAGLLTPNQSGLAFASANAFAAVGGAFPDDNQSLQIFAATAYSNGPVATVALNAGGAGYAVNDTGIINAGGSDATYRVTAVDGGGGVTGFVITANGTNYATGNGIATADNGAQPGIGAGFTVNITAVTPGNGTLKVVTYYQVIDVA